jgi:hypothetical protein
LHLKLLALQLHYTEQKPKGKARLSTLLLIIKINMQVSWTKLISLDQTGINSIKDGVSGVYRISHYDQNNNSYYVHYVGQAENLKERLGQHLISSETNSCCNSFLKNNKCYFRACSISTQSERDGAEVALYQKYQPKCVERIPDVKAININFE